MTFVRAITLAIEATIKLALIMTLPVAVMAPLAPFFTPPMITGLLIWTLRIPAPVGNAFRETNRRP